MLGKFLKKLGLSGADSTVASRAASDGSDYSRWSNKKNLAKSWDERTFKIARLVDENSSVIEFGAARLVMKDFLPDGCSYAPSDLVDRGEGTIVCDLNAPPLPAFQHYDFATFSGVLEYVKDVPTLIAHLSKTTDNIVASYAVTELNDVDRSAQGWVNGYSSEEFVRLFDEAGFTCDQTDSWKTQKIYRFRKQQ